MEAVVGNAHGKSFENIYKALGNNPELGVSEVRVEELLKRHGRNEFKGKRE
jgi:hypothetical protein